MNLILTHELVSAWDIVYPSILSNNVKALRYAHMLKDGASVGLAKNKQYNDTFFKEFPSLKGNVVVHHAIEQQVIDVRWPGLFSELEIHSFENLRGISNEIDALVHLSKIRIEWNNFYAIYPNGSTPPTREDVLNKVKEIDDLFGKYYSPPIRKSIN